MMQLKVFLKQYDRIFLPVSGLPDSDQVAEEICRAWEAVSSEQDDGKTALVLYAGEMEVNSSEKLTIQCITPEEEKELLDLYFTYEFSDRFRVCFFPEQYGSLRNYVETGLLTEEEAYKAMVM